MKIDALVDQLRIEDFTEAQEISKGLSSGDYLLAELTGNSVKCRCFIRAIGSNIPVLEHQYLRTELINKRIEQSKKLIEAWVGHEEEECKIIRVDINEEQFYSLFYSPETKIFFGALINVNKPFEEKHYKLKSMDL